MYLHFQSEVLNKVGPRHVASDTIKSVLDKACPVLLDRECVSVLVERVSHELTEPSLSQTEEEEEEEFSRCKRGVRLLKVKCRGGGIVTIATHVHVPYTCTGGASNSLH